MTAVREIELSAQLLELAHDAILVRDASTDVITYWSEGAVDTYGYSRVEAVGRVKTELLNPTYNGTTADAVEEAVRSVGRWEGEVEHSHRDGRRITVSSRRVLGPGPAPGASRILEINRDVTEEKRLHGELAILGDRVRIGREINDIAIQGMFAVGLELQALATLVDDRVTAERLEAAVERLDGVIRDLRSHIFGIRRPPA